MNNNNPGLDMAQQMANMWLEFATKMSSSGMAFRPGDAPTDAARSMRNASFAALSQSADEYMRSPQFLQMMKQSMDAAIAFRKQLNAMFTEAQHSVQGVARQDIDGVTQTVRRVETRVLGRVEELCDRLDEISRRLEALEGRQKGSNGQAAHAPEGRVADESSETLAE